MAYRRFDNKENFLIVVNPADRETSFDCVLTGKAVYGWDEATVFGSK